MTTINRPYKNCLLIDDCNLDHLINIKMIERANFAENFIVTRSPEDALKMLRDKFIVPDLIFFDITMPGMNGFDFIKEYKKIGIDRKLTKIFILSSSINPTDIKKATENDYVTGYIFKTLTQNVLQKIAQMKI